MRVSTSANRLRNSWRVWAVDFQFDLTTDGRAIKIVSIIDAHTRECAWPPGKPIPRPADRIIQVT
jgi:hypothetical protein